MNEMFHTMVHTWAAGGVVMAAMALLAVVTYVTAGHLMLDLYHRGLTRASDERLRRWVAQPTEAPAKVRELIRYTQDEVHSLEDIEGRFREVEAAKVPEVNRRLAFLNVFVIAAPLFGLLGTVSGMLLTFRAISVGGGASETIAKGISEALVATQTGMMVAIPGLMMAFVAKRWRNEYVAFLARLEGITLRHFRPNFAGMTRQFTRSDFPKFPDAPPKPPAPPVAEPQAAPMLAETMPA